MLSSAAQLKCTTKFPEAIIIIEITANGFSSRAIAEGQPFTLTLKALQEQLMHLRRIRKAAKVVWFHVKEVILQHEEHACSGQLFY